MQIKRGKWPTYLIVQWYEGGIQFGLNFPQHLKSITNVPTDFNPEVAQIIITLPQL